MDLPERVVVGANGAYWRDYIEPDGLGNHYSMCPVSTDNDPVVPVAVYVRVDNPPKPTDDEPTTANGRDLLAHAVQYNPADADRKITAAKIIAVENEARATPEPPDLSAALNRIEQDAGWLHDNVPDYSPDGVATLRDIAREIAKAAYEIRSTLAQLPETGEPR